jgi:signal transduction histidine kinase
MRTSSGSAIVAASVVCLLCFVDVSTAWAEQRRVLALIASRRDAPGAAVFDEVFGHVLGQKLGPALDYYGEYLDAQRFADADYLPALAAFLKRKYARIQFDIILTPTNAGADFLQRYRDELFPGVPVVFSGTAGVNPGDNAAGVIHVIEMAKSIEMALELQPHIREVYVLTGTSAFDKFYEGIAREQLRRLENQVSIVYWSGLTLDDAVSRVSRLPPDAILYPMPFTEDAAGQRFLALESFDRIAEAASVPVYTWTNHTMGRGAVGGALNSTDALAREVAMLALRVLGGEDPESIPVETLDEPIRQVDWRHLQRWGISESRLPAGTVVRFREPGPWERYRWYIVGTVAVVALQAALIAGLLIQRQRRRRVEHALRVSSRQNQDLAGRLITAQEEERTRIARDLHDDASQELVGLAMALSMLKARLSRAAAGDEVTGLLSDLQQRTVTLGESLRTLSHELHPGVLQHAGIVAALRTYGAEFERRHGIRTRVEAADEFRSLDPETALCLYRVVQEALTNAARHSGADDVLVKLEQTNGCLRLSVRDNGAGFDASRRTGTGLGLQSIDERVQLRDGTATITSKPGKGTMVFVSIPVPAMELGASAVAS